MKKKVFALALAATLTFGSAVPALASGTKSTPAPTAAPEPPPIAEPLARFYQGPQLVRTIVAQAKSNTSFFIVSKINC